MRLKIAILEIRVEAGELDFWRDFGARVTEEGFVTPRRQSDCYTLMKGIHGGSTASLWKCSGHDRL